MTIDASKVSMWASIFSIPLLLGWYITGYQTLLSTLQSGPKSSVPSVLMGAFVLFATVALIANAMAQMRMGALLGGRPATAPQQTNVAPAPASEPATTPLKLRAWRLTRDPANPTPPEIKSKLWLIFRNEGEHAIAVRAPQWRGLPLEAEPYNCRCIQPEMHRGKGDWATKQEVFQARIEPGMGFRMWIGFNPLIKDADLIKKLEMVDLGKLIIPIKIGDQPEIDSLYEV